MRWSSDAVSLLGRTCDLNTDKTYELLRQLREHSATHLKQRWRLTTDRHQRSDGAGARQLTQAECSETKRRLGLTGRNSKRKLLPGWAIVTKLPLYKFKLLLAGWKCVRSTVVLRGGQRAISGLVTRRARTARDCDDLVKWRCGGAGGQA